MGIGTGHLGWIFNPVGFGSGVGHRQLGVCGDFGEQGQAAIPRQGAHHWFVFGGGDTHHHVGVYGLHHEIDHAAVLRG